ncbi:MULTISPECIES: two-component system regulatory protein YycI [unclassified Staphylococcus]|uniref:two-component system regulatory protein YycI n=1 Tax=unclassified Staphylococcus TaxID=91994 RepID=UPI0021CF635E|nr:MULTISPECIES: two-component system regulatory protein YycI [unclassified Staphylococcus]UXR78366.1 two-component system regulatory protein YycI [Staphylococcus sp. IVB6227]UXR82531.1 two-component system regulatory protein YycI [Staphylococcus sp. IVB6214]
MNWKHAKTLFIIVFFLINVVLVILYVDKYNKSKLNPSATENGVNFAQENIKLPKNIPEVSKVKMQLITARSRNFEEDTEDRSDSSQSENGYVLTKEVNETVDVKLDPISHLKPYINDNVYKGNEYQYQETKGEEIKYEQTFEGFPIMNNKRAALTFVVADNQVKSYKQAAMEDIRPSKGANNKRHKVISAYEALEALYYNQYLKDGDEVKGLRLGYYTVVKETNLQVLQANWEIQVKRGNQTKTYYVEAVSSNPKIIEQ